MFFLKIKPVYCLPIFVKTYGKDGCGKCRNCSAKLKYNKLYVQN